MEKIESKSSSKMSSHQQQNDATKQGGFGKIPEDKTEKSNEEFVHQSLARGSTQPFDWKHISDGKEQKCDEVPGKKPQQEPPRSKMSSHQQQNDATKQGSFGKTSEDITGKSNEQFVHQSFAQGRVHKSDGKEHTSDEVPGKRPQQQQPRIRAVAKERDEYHLSEFAKSNMKYNNKSKNEEARNMERVHLEEQYKTIRSLQKANDDLQALFEEKNEELMKEREMRQTDKEKLSEIATQGENSLWKQIDDLNKRAARRENSLLTQIDDLNKRTNTFSNTIKNLRKENEELTMRIPELTNDRDEYHLRELAKYKSQVEDARKIERAKLKEQDKTIWGLQQANENLRERLHQLEYESEEDKQQLKSEHEHNVVLKNNAAKLKQDINELKQANEELKQANEELKDRLSAVLGVKQQENIPNIADLSDMNRPTKLAERFEYLYDNEWTDYFEVLHQQHGMGEKEAIEQMLQVCLTIYQECRSKASNDLQTLAQELGILDKETDIHFVKDLKEKRKRNFKNDIKRLRQPMEEKVRIIIKDRTNEKAFAEFWTKCLEICWLMAIQDPPVSMETSTGRLGELFNATFYRPYTKSGKYVEFIVWPALRLTEDGSLLCKGVAQGTSVSGKEKDDSNRIVQRPTRKKSAISQRYS